MSNIPSTPWLAGPAPRRYDPDEAYYECVNCGVKVTREGSYGCQDDTCTARVCETCKAQCVPCGCTACPEHMVDYGGERTCTVCLRLAVEEAAKELKEAV